MILFKQIAACIILTSLPPQDARAYRIFPQSAELPEIGNNRHQFQIPSRLQTYREYNAFTKPTLDTISGYVNKQPKIQFYDVKQEDNFIPQLTTSIPSDSRTSHDTYLSSYTEAIPKKHIVNIPDRVGGYYYHKPIIPFDEETTKHINIHSETPHPDDKSYGVDVYVSSSTVATSGKVTIKSDNLVTGNDNPEQSKPFDHPTGQINLIQPPTTLIPSDSGRGDDSYVSSSTEAITTKHTVNIHDKVCGCYYHKPPIPFDEVSKIDTSVIPKTPLPDDNSYGDDVYVSSSTEATSEKVTGNDNPEQSKPFDHGTGQNTLIPPSTPSIPSDSRTGDDIYVSYSTEAILKPSHIPDKFGGYYYHKPIIPFDEETTKYKNIHSKTSYPDEKNSGVDVYVSSSTETTSGKVTIKSDNLVTGNDNPAPIEPLDHHTGQINLIQQPSTLIPSDSRKGDDSYVSSFTQAIPTKHIVNIHDKFCGCYYHKPIIPFDEVTKKDTSVTSATPLPEENTNGDDVYVSSSTKPTSGEVTVKIYDKVTGNDNSEPSKPFDDGTGHTDTFIQQLTTSIPSDSGTGDDIYVSSSTEAIPEKYNINIHGYYYPKPNKAWEDRIKRDTYIHLTTPLPDDRSYGFDVYVTSSTEATSGKVTLNISDELS